MRTIVIAAILLLPAAAAFDPPNAPQVDSFPFEGTATAWLLDLPVDSFFSVWLGASHEDTTFASAGLWFVDADTLAFSGLIQPSWYPEGGHELNVQGDLPGTLASEITGDAQWPIEMRVDFTPFIHKQWIVVAMGAADGNVAGEFRTYADGGATILATTRAPAFLHTERDFTGTANVIAREELPVREAVAEAKLQLDASVAQPVEHALFASFWGGSHLGLQELSIDTPTGAMTGREWYLLNGTGPGDYSFHIDQNVDWYDNQPTCRAIEFERCWRIPAYALGTDITIPTGG